MDAHMLAWLDQEDAHVAAIVRKHGWFIQYVRACSPGTCSSLPVTGHDLDDDGPPFGYTVGLFGLHHPELLIFGLPPGPTAKVLNSLGDRVRAGADLLPGSVITVAGWPHRIIPEAVPNPGAIVFSANRYYQRPDEASVPVLQLSYDDAAGRFPWQPGYEAPHLQPRPGTFQS